jgi:ferredoxin-NADP reductase
MRESYRLRVARVIPETADACSLEFEVDSAHTETFAYRPGQFLTVRIPSDRCGSVARCYSLSSSPHTDDRLKVTVKRTADGYGSNWLCDTISAGDELEALPPAGVYAALVRRRPAALRRRQRDYAGHLDREVGARHRVRAGRAALRQPGRGLGDLRR